MRRVACAVGVWVALLAGCGGDAGRIAGHWEAMVPGMGDSVHVLLRVASDGLGGIDVWLSIPEQPLRDERIATASLKGDRLRLRGFEGRLAFDGAYDPGADVITGAFRDVTKTQARFVRVDSLFTPPADYTYAPPPATGDGWEVGSASDAGLDVGRLSELVREICSGKHFKEVDSFLIARHGKLVLDVYRNEHYYGRDEPHNTASVTKSITSAMVGIALAEGRLTGLDEKMLPYFEDHYDIDNLDDAKRSITLEQLITMRSGLDCSNLDKLSPGHTDKLFASSDWIEFYLDLPMSKRYAPGEKFVYCEGNAMLMGEILRYATGMSMDAYAHNRIFKPLGVTDYHFERSPRGKILTGTGLHLRSRDMAKFGQLYLNKGRWQGQQLVPEAWVAESTRRRLTDTFYFGGYGYFWWTDTYTIGSHDYDAFIAAGSAGQHIDVIPGLDMVIVSTGWLHEGPDPSKQFAQMVREYVIDAVVE